jgi:hypothetical protein
MEFIPGNEYLMKFRASEYQYVLLVRFERYEDPNEARYLGEVFDEVYDYEIHEPIGAFRLISFRKKTNIMKTHSLSSIDDSEQFILLHPNTLKPEQFRDSLLVPGKLMYVFLGGESNIRFYDRTKAREMSGLSALKLPLDVKNQVRSYLGHDILTEEPEVPLQTEEPLPTKEKCKGKSCVISGGRRLRKRTSKSTRRRTRKSFARSRRSRRRSKV